MTLEAQLADTIALAIKTATAPLLARIQLLEQRAPLAGKDGRDGQDGVPVDPGTIQAMVEAGVSKAMSAMPVPRDGRDGQDGASVDPVVIQAMVEAGVSKAMSSVPIPRDGRDGTSVALDDVRALVAAQLAPAVAALPSEVERVVAALPPPRDGKDGASVDPALVAAMVVDQVKRNIDAVPKPERGEDGVSVSGALVDRAGHLALTFSDGTVRDVGVVVGSDADPAEVKRLVLEEVAKIPRPVDGKDGLPGAPGPAGLRGEIGVRGEKGEQGPIGETGLGFDDLNLVYDDTRGYLLRVHRGDKVKEWSIPLPFDAGVWQAGRHYPKGAGVTVKGAWWIAQAETSARPGDGTPDSRSWRLAVKGGRDGKPGPPGRDGDHS